MRATIGGSEAPGLFAIVAGQSFGYFYFRE